MLVNKTKPLPRDLLNELLPHVSTNLPKPWRLRRVSASVLEVLRFEPQVTVYGRIRGLGRGNEGASISQAAVSQVIERSVRRGGVLSELYDGQTGAADAPAMARIVSITLAAWRGCGQCVAGQSMDEQTRAWGGIYAVGALMDDVMQDVNAESNRAVAAAERRVRRIERRCAWTSGRWPVLSRAWDDLRIRARIRGSSVRISRMSIGDGAKIRGATWLLNKTSDASYAIWAQAAWLWMLSWFSTSTRNESTRSSVESSAATARATSSTKAGWSYACIVSRALRRLA